MGGKLSTEDSNKTAGNPTDRIDLWLASLVNPDDLAKEQAEWKKIQTELKKAKEELDQTGFRLSHECVIMLEESKKENTPMYLHDLPELKFLSEQYEIKDKLYLQLLTKYNNYRGIGKYNYKSGTHVDLPNWEIAPLWVLRGVCPDCGCTEGLSMIIDGRETD